MSTYAKVFHSLLASSLMSEEVIVRWLFVAMIVMADRDGVVEASLPGLARLANLPLEDVRKALAVLIAPDEFSRTKTHDGRRVVEVDGGWQIVNYELYRDRATVEESREKAAARQQRKRERDTSRAQRDARERSRDGHETSRVSRPQQQQQQQQQQQSAQSRAARSSPDGFDAFWRAYAKRTDRLRAEKAWRKLAPSAELAAVITAKATAQSLAIEDKKYLPAPSRWIEGRRWEDEPVPQQRRNGMPAPAAVGSYLAPGESPVQAI